MYVLSTRCQWRAIPKDLPPRSTVYDYFDLWKLGRHARSHPRGGLARSEPDAAIHRQSERQERGKDPMRVDGGPTW